MKRSAGILPYKIVDNDIYVYLERPGGPYFKGKDKWGICKGEYTNERAIDAAIREFKEESGNLVKEEDLFFIGSTKVSKEKVINIFGINKDFDPSKMTSNTFKKEFPPNSGKIREYPEMEEARWFKIEEAKKKIFKYQDKILDKLVSIIDNKV